jgi:hypothetical protein
MSTLIGRISEKMGHSPQGTRALMGEDFWPYGVESNRKVLDYFLDQHHAQGLSKRRVSVDELFHAATYPPTNG